MWLQSELGRLSADMSKLNPTWRTKWKEKLHHWKVAQVMQNISWLTWRQWFEWDIPFVDLTTTKRRLQTSGGAYGNSHLHEIAYERAEWTVLDPSKVMAQVMMMQHIFMALVAIPTLAFCFGCYLRWWKPMQARMIILAEYVYPREE